MNNTLPELSIGSVKNILGVKGKAPYIFQYSNRYSVFDWGAMPDDIPNKGRALAVMANAFFKLVEKPARWKELFEHWPHLKSSFSDDLIFELTMFGLKHHSRGPYHSDGTANKEDKLFDCIGVNPFNVLRPQQGQDGPNYSAYRERPANTLIPLEAIFRFGVPTGSSLPERSGDMAYRECLGLQNVAREGDVFERPLIEFSTKLEALDRYLYPSEALEISGLSPKEYVRLRSIISLLSYLLKYNFEKVGITLWDGKFEFAFGRKMDGEREIVLIDSIGPDELRLSCEGVQLSKEVLRKFYRASEWFQAVKVAKQMLVRKEISQDDWQDYVAIKMNSPAPHLPKDMIDIVDHMYMALANAVLHMIEQEPVFVCMELPEVVSKLREHL